MVVRLTIGIAILAVYCAVVLPRIGRWSLAHLGHGAVPTFLFLLAALTSAALVADRMGLEGIVGAFFAGLALNRLVKSAHAEAKESFEFVGAALLVPFFLLATGMLLDPEQFTELKVLAIGGLSLAIVLVGKAAASFVAGRLAGFDLSEIRLVFGLTVAQAAATLAAVTIGTEAGIFDEELLSATLVVVLASVIVSSIVTRKAARSLDPSTPTERLQSPPRGG
jgi:Kef-type K+ transport system membrane component KefB